MYKRKDTAEDISIVMAVYNHEATVAQALESALAQVMPYKSIIYCLNDASTDRSAEILEQYASRYPDKIRVFTSPSNLGSGKKSMLYHNPPIKGRYWCLLAGDDYWTDVNKLSKQILYLDNNKKTVGCSCNSMVSYEVDGALGLISPCKNNWNILDLLLLKSKYAFYVHTTSIVWRNIYGRGNSFLPPAFKQDFASGDVILGHMMLGRGGEMFNIPEVMNCYRVSGKGVWTSMSSDEQARANEALIYNLEKATSFKVKLLMLLQPYRLKYSFLRKLILGPINE
jgi:glycosyltransferase involved in cell wall biosynthesis